MDIKLYRSLIVLAILGFADSVYMAIYKITSNDSMCLGSGDCAIVNASRYSEIYGIPLGIIGALGMIAILVALWLEKRTTGFFAENSRLAVFGMTFAGFLYVVYLTYIEIFVIRAICPFCVIIAVIMTLMFIIASIRLKTEPTN
jgi:uncharacterized membrane protein